MPRFSSPRRERLGCAAKPARGRLTVGVLAAALLAVTTGCSSGRAATSPSATVVPSCPSSGYACQVHVPFRHDRKPTLQFEGDSLTVQAADDILARFGATYDVAIDAKVGTTTHFAADVVKAAAHLAPSVVVIELGTNDASCPTSTEKFICGPITPGYVSRSVPERLQAFDREFPHSCVIFVVPDDHNPSWSPANVRLIDSYERAHFAHLADWQAAWRPAYFDAPDNPHPNARGRQALIGLVAKAIDRC